MARSEFRPQRPRVAAASPLTFETLEPRQLLSVNELLTTATQPTGALSGKIVYTSGGHGWQWSDTLNRWATDRGDNIEIVEDFGNQDQMSFFADYVLRAGGTVVPMRPVGHQLNEVVLDNDSPGVTYSGAWSNSTSTIHYDEDYGAVADAVGYRFASIAATETAVATYRPTIPEAGYYPIYTWVRDGTDRTNQLYRIHDSGGGVTEIRVDHRMVGKGWVYLGTYHFDAGTAGFVEISNRSTAGGSVVIADAIRFGNGMGDVKDGAAGVGAASGVISGYPREDENSLMWLWRAIGQGNSAATVIGTSNVSAPTRMAEHMNVNANPFGTSVYIGFHSNAAGGRGAVGLITTSGATPNQDELALYTGRQINQDMQALNGQFEHAWSTRTTHTFSGSFGEIDEGASAEMDMTIIEVAFHDQQQDAELMRDPKVRDQLARSTYEAALEYFDNFGGLTAPAATPSKPTGVKAMATAGGDLTVSWTPGPTGVPGGPATAYRVYASRDGRGYLGYVEVAAGAGNSYTFPAAELDDAPYYFQIAAVNAGGESARSAVTAAQVRPAADRILIVDGFDRYDRTQNERYPYAFTGDGLVDRVRVRSNNSFDYLVPAGQAIAAAGANVGFDSVANEAIVSGTVSLAGYDAVIWLLGEESTVNQTFALAEQNAVSAYLAAGGKVFVSGSEIAWDLDQSNNGRAFYNDQLRADYVGDDAASYSVTGVSGSIFAGLAGQFDNGQLSYDVNTPDVIAPLGGATPALTYSTGGTAAIQYAGGAGERLVVLGFPWESLLDPSLRASIVGQVLTYFGSDVEFNGADLVIDNDLGSPAYVETGTWSTASATGYNGSTYRFAAVGGANAATWTFHVPVATTGEVFVQYRSGSNRADAAQFTVNDGATSTTIAVNQKLNDAAWVSLGTFSFAAGARTVALDAATSAGGSVVIADAVRVVLDPVATTNGDFNADGMIDGADLLLWQQGLGTSSGATRMQGDADGDGLVDDVDLDVWKAAFGEPAVVAGAAASEAAVRAILPLPAERSAWRPAALGRRLPAVTVGSLPPRRLPLTAAGQAVSLGTALAVGAPMATAGDLDAAFDELGEGVRVEA